MTTEARSLEQCVADARAILDEGALGPLGARGRLITLSRNTYSSLLDLVEAAERWTVADAAYIEGDAETTVAHQLSRAEAKLSAALRAVHESLQENLPR